MHLTNLEAKENKMSWELIKREDSFQGSDRPFISISHDHFSFNSMFVRMAEIGPEQRVIIYVDAENYKLAFEFSIDFPLDKKDHSLALSQASSETKGKKRRALNSSATAIVKKFPWVKSVTKLPIKDRRFEPKREGNRWVIQLCPAFENRKTRESGDIPSDAKGIYRYIRESGEIVYIGRGEIKKRLAASDRIDWDFDIIEYSIIEDPDKQLEWEDYWISRYQEQNNGKLPIYNKISASSRPKEETFSSQ